MSDKKSKKNPLRSSAHAAKDLADTYKKNEPANKKVIENIEKEVENIKKDSKPEIEMDFTENEVNENIEVKQEEQVNESEVIAQLKDQVARKVAELENFRKRTQKEKLDLIEYANSKLLFKLLEVKDDFENAFDHSDTSSHEDMLKGFDMINKKMAKVLEEFNVKIMDNPTGKEFNVDYHEALMAQPSKEIEEGHIIQQLQKGYLLGEKVLRHSKVITSQG